MTQTQTKAQKQGGKAKKGGSTGGPPSTHSKLRNKLDDGNLDLSMSDLNSVPLTDLIPIKQKVVELDLSYNKIMTIPDDFCMNMTSLVELNLSKNKLIVLPGAFGQLTNLRRLEIYGNQLTYLPLSFASLSHLVSLDAHDNPWSDSFGLKAVVGPCGTDKQCQECAVAVLKFMKETRQNKAIADAQAKEAALEQKKKARKPFKVMQGQYTFPPGLAVKPENINYPGVQLPKLAIVSKSDCFLTDEESVEKPCDKENGDERTCAFVSMAETPKLSMAIQEDSVVEKKSHLLKIEQAEKEAQMAVNGKSPKKPKAKKSPKNDAKPNNGGPQLSRNVTKSGSEDSVDAQKRRNRADNDGPGFFGIIFRALLFVGLTLTLLSFAVSKFETEVYQSHPQYGPSLVRINQAAKKEFSNAYSKAHWHFTDKNGLFSTAVETVKKFDYQGAYDKAAVCARQASDTGSVWLGHANKWYQANVYPHLPSREEIGAVFDKLWNHYCSVWDFIASKIRTAFDKGLTAEQKHSFWEAVDEVSRYIKLFLQALARVSNDYVVKPLTPHLRPYIMKILEAI